MQGIESTFIFFIVVSLISLLISIASYRSHPEEKLFKWQCFLWASLLLMFTVQVVLKDESHLIINLSNTVGYLFIFALIKIIEFDTEERKVGRIFLALPLITMSLTTFAYLSTSDPFWIYLPNSLMMFSILAHRIGRLIIKDKKKLDSKMRVNLIIACSSLATHELFHPFAAGANDQESLQFGFSIFVVIITSLAMIIPSFVLELTSNKYNKHMNDAVEKRSNMLIHSVKMASLGEISGGIAHEINNPLAVMKLSQQRLQKENSKETSDKLLNNIGESIDRVANIVKSLQQFSGVDNRQNLSAFRFSELVDDYLLFTHHYYRSSNISVSVDDKTNDALVYANKRELSQVILELMKNAHFEANKSIDQDDKWIKLSLDIVADQIYFNVTDSGSGIDELIRPKIFQPFFTSKDIGDGTGLGLSTSLGIVKKYAGDLSYLAGQSNTTFQVKMPVCMLS